MLLPSKVYHQPDIVFSNGKDPPSSFKAHRLILASVSNILKEVLWSLDGGYAFIETMIILPGVSDEILKLFLKWLYSNEVCLEADQVSEWEDLLNHLGIKYVLRTSREIYSSPAINIVTDVADNGGNEKNADEILVVEKLGSMIINEEEVNSDKTSTNEHSSLSVNVESSNFLLNENKVTCSVQCDLSFNESLSKSIDEEDLDISMGNATIYHDAPFSVNIKTKVDTTDVTHNETLFQDCVEELSSEESRTSESENVEHKNVNSFEDYSEESDSTGSDNDSSWINSESDVKDSDEEETPVKKTKKLKCLEDIINVDLKTVRPSVVEVWLSESGPVSLASRCLCKGTCVRNCVCRAGGNVCTKKCSCNPSKCKLRAEAAASLQVDRDDVFNSGSSREDVSDGLSASVVVTPKSSNIELYTDLLPSSCPPSIVSSNTRVDDELSRRKKRLFTNRNFGPQEL